MEGGDRRQNPRHAVDTIGSTRYVPAYLNSALNGALLIVGITGRIFVPRNLRIRKNEDQEFAQVPETRHRENRLVRRKGRVYIINKLNPRFKARQG